MYFMFFKKSNKRILKILLTNLLNYMMKDEGQEMTATPTEEKLIGVTLLQLGVAASFQHYKFIDCSAKNEFAT